MSNNRQAPAQDGQPDRMHSSPPVPDGLSVPIRPSAPAPDKTVIAVNKQGAILHFEPSGIPALAKDALLFVPTKRYADDMIHLKHQRLTELNHTLASFAEEGAQSC